MQPIPTGLVSEKQDGSSTPYSQPGSVSPRSAIGGRMYSSQTEISLLAVGIPRTVSTNSDGSSSSRTRNVEVVTEEKSDSTEDRKKTVKEKKAKQVSAIAFSLSDVLRRVPKEPLTESQQKDEIKTREERAKTLAAVRQMIEQYKMAEQASDSQKVLYAFLLKLLEHDGLKPSEDKTVLIARHIVEKYKNTPQLPDNREVLHSFLQKLDEREELKAITPEVMESLEKLRDYKELFYYFLQLSANRNGQEKGVPFRDESVGVTMFSYRIKKEVVSHFGQYPFASWAYMVAAKHLFVGKKMDETNLTKEQLDLITADFIKFMATELDSKQKLLQEDLKDHCKSFVAVVKEAEFKVNHVDNLLLSVIILRCVCPELVTTSMLLKRAEHDMNRRIGKFFTCLYNHLIKSSSELVNRPVQIDPNIPRILALLLPSAEQNETKSKAAASNELKPPSKMGSLANSLKNFLPFGSP